MEGIFGRDLELAVIERFLNACRQDDVDFWPGGVLLLSVHDLVLMRGDLEGVFGAINDKIGLSAMLLISGGAMALALSTCHPWSTAAR